MSRGWIKLSDALGDIARNMRAELESDQRNLRRHGRVRPDVLWCSLGTVLDVSASGMRLQRTRTAHGVHVVKLQAHDQCVLLRVRVVWARKLGFRRHEIGVEFLEMNDNGRAFLRTIARSQ